MTLIQKRVFVPVGDLASGIPSVPVFEGEATLDATKEAANLLARFADAVQKEDWQAFGDLFSDNCWWKDSLTLTFDKRTLQGRKSIVEAWKALSLTRKPSEFTSEKNDILDMDAKFTRMGPALGCLDVPFRFSTQAPESNCIGQLQFIPEGNGWKIWIIATGVVSLADYPFSPLPRQTPSMIDASQRGKSEAQGLPRVQGVLDAIVIGVSSCGLSNTIMLDAIGANVAAFDIEPVVGGNWSKRYDNVTLHHPAFMIQLPLFPVPSEGYPEYLTGRDLTRYYSSAVETLKLPVFGGIRVLANIFDEAMELWRVRIQDIATGDEAVLEAKNISISTGFLFDLENPKLPAVTDRQLFTGPIQHTSEYRTPEPYKDKAVVVVGSGNSGHDVAKSLVVGGAKSVTILQRSPSVLVDYPVILPILAMRYQGDVSVDTADFLDMTMPLGIKRDMARPMMASLLQSQAKRCAELESKGYMVDMTPCLVSRQFDERGRSIYPDQPKTFDLVLQDRIKIARGEATGFVEGGLVVHDKAEGKDRVLEADGVVFATGYDFYDLPKQYAESGFVDSKSASMLVNVGRAGVDAEGELPGIVTASGHPHLYFSGFAILFSRWIARYTAIQIMADVKGKFPAQYPRTSS
ncbi:hypothetical protein V490_03680 [Pseudogymnoascus sp. VKM F-3557]|nr:hypothetical protein V490_03680 [Pseudogymnoascus sp. VKM F-3557]